MLHKIFSLFSLFFLLPMHVNAEESYAKKSIYEKPLIERYVMDELKSLRHDQQDLEKRMVIEITDRELALAEQSLNYSEKTITFFFYIIAGAATLITLVGWQSLTEIRKNTKKMAEQQLKKLSEQYETKFKKLESDLKRKTNYITSNHIEIEKINEIHNLWLRAQNSQTPEQKLGVYDEILKIRPGDLEALTYKADVAMEMREFNWALSISNKVLELDQQNSSALYQRACAYSCLGAEEQALMDLELAILGSQSLRDIARDEADFDMLKGNERFENLMNAESQ